MLQIWGWDAHFQQSFVSLGMPDAEPARIIGEHRQLFRVITAAGERLARVAGRLLVDPDGPSPAVGDWVAMRSHGETAIIHAVLNRRSAIRRKASGRTTHEQVLATNVDTVFVVTSYNDDFNPRRLERYLTVTWDAGAQPVVVLNKVDLADNATEITREAQSVARHAPVLTVCALKDDGLASLTPYMPPGRTVVLLGSSGVGKSTIVNRLLGTAVQEVQSIRATDDKGRHTTRSRQLFLLPSGALVVDTPGLRELSLWASEVGLERTFDDIEHYARLCRFRDCTHGAEPGCAVRQALESGSIEPERLISYHKLRKELAYLDSRVDPEARSNVKRRWKSIHKGMRTARKKGWFRDKT